MNPEPLNHEPLNPEPLKPYICLLYILIILFWGLRPFNFSPSNDVEWLKSENGISFYDLGVVYGPADYKKSDQISLLEKDKSITIEIWLTPGSDGYSRFSYIFCLCDGQQRELFSLSQAKSLLNLSKYRNPKNRKSVPYRWRWLKNTFFKGRKRLLTVTSNKTSTTIFIDGEKIKKFKNYSLILTKNLGPEQHIIIGNDPSGTKPWTGKIHGLAIYSHALSPKRVSEHFEKWRDENALSLLEEKNLIALYPMDERDGDVIHNASNDRHHLLIPHKFKIFKKNFLQLPNIAFKLNSSTIRDIGINIVGFIPLGFFLFYSFNYKSLTASSWRFIGLALIGGIALSFIVEIFQAYLPTRRSSLVDVIFNALGTGLGVTLALVFIKIKNPDHRTRQS